MCKRFAYIGGMPDATISESAYDTVGETAEKVVLSFRVTEQMNQKITDAAAKAHLPKSSLLRLSIDRGIDRLLEQLEVKPEGAE